MHCMKWFKVGDRLFLALKIAKKSVGRGESMKLIPSLREMRCFSVPISLVSQSGPIDLNRE